MQRITVAMIMVGLVAGCSDEAGKIVDAGGSDSHSMVADAGTDGRPVDAKTAADAPLVTIDARPMVDATVSVGDAAVPDAPVPDAAMPDAISIDAAPSPDAGPLMVEVIASDSFNRPDADKCDLGAMDNLYGGTEARWYVPLLTHGAVIVGKKLANDGLGSGGVALSTFTGGGCSTAGTTVGQDLDISMTVEVPLTCSAPTDDCPANPSFDDSCYWTCPAAYYGVEAGAFFHGRQAFAADGPFGGANAGYWVYLDSWGFVSVRNLNTNTLLTSVKAELFDDHAPTHTLELAVSGDFLSVAVDGALVLDEISIPPTDGDNLGAVGIYFAAFDNPGLAGGQTVDDLVVTTYDPL